MLRRRVLLAVIVSDGVAAISVFSCEMLRWCALKLPAIEIDPDTLPLCWRVRVYGRTGTCV